MAPRTIRAASPAIWVAACLCGCAPSEPLPTIASHPAPIVTPAVTKLVEAPRYYGSSTEPRARHRSMARHERRHQQPQQAQDEGQQAQADTVNPPFGAGE